MYCNNEPGLGLQAALQLIQSMSQTQLYVIQAAMSHNAFVQQGILPSDSTSLWSEAIIIGFEFPNTSQTLWDQKSISVWAAPAEDISTACVKHRLRHHRSIVL